MGQDPNAVPHPRVPYEQISYRRPPAPWPPHKQTQRVAKYRAAEADILARVIDSPRWT